MCSLATSQHLDAFKKPRKSHLFFGLMRVFRREYIVLSLLLVVQVLGGFASPLGIRNLLWYVWYPSLCLIDLSHAIARYIEKDGENATIKPWFWILWLFLGPTICSITNQWYTFITVSLTFQMTARPHAHLFFIQACATVQAECMLTQLVFEHSLRIRMKAETQESSVVPNATLNSEATPPYASTSNGASGPEGFETSEIASGHSTQPVTSPNDPRSEIRSTKSESSKTFDNASTAKRPPGRSSANNLVGRINNLVTTDLGNIVDARSSFLYLLIFVPLQMTLCMVFLYNILGWRYVLVVTFGTDANGAAALLSDWPSWSFCLPFQAMLRSSCKIFKSSVSR